MKRSAESRITELRDILSRAQQEYYTLNAPTLPDSEYDLLFREMEGLEDLYPEYFRHDSPTQRVGAPVVPVHPVTQPPRQQFKWAVHGCPDIRTNQIYDRFALAAAYHAVIHALSMTRVPEETPPVVSAVVPYLVRCRDDLIELAISELRQSALAELDRRAV